MRNRIWIPALYFALLVSFPLNAQRGGEALRPHLEQKGEHQQLIVDGKPFLVLGGEAYNNSATSLSYMQSEWVRLREMHLNTVLVGFSWAMIEPTEGKYDFSLIDGLIRDARANNLHLILLWFGSWKNSWSSYTPDWVKRDYERFPRARLQNGQATERLSAFSDANREADARAFAALMHRLHEVDDRHTVLMVQVENEVGMIPDARDHSSLANAAYQRPVPRELLEYLEKHKDSLHPELREQWRASGYKTSGNWEAVFGPGGQTEDLFMAWFYASYIGKVAEAGKAQYNIPLFTNAALIRPDYAPGQFNSGGPLSHSIDLWKAAAPQLDFLAPDIYFEFKKWSAEYDRPGNPLFIPESATGTRGAAQALYAVGQHAALGYSPFGIDKVGGTEEGDKALARSYDILSQLTPLILENQPKHNVAAVMLEELTPSQRITLGGYALSISANFGRRPLPTEPEYPQEGVVRIPHGLFLAAGPDEFYMAGNGLTITFSAPANPGMQVGLATVEEGQFVDGVWQKGRTLAGDDTGQGNSISLRANGQSILRVTVYRYR